MQASQASSFQVFHEIAENQKAQQEEIARLIELCDSALTEEVSITREEAQVSFRIEQERQPEEVPPTEFTPLSTGRSATSSQRARIPDVLAEVKTLCDDLESVDL